MKEYNKYKDSNIEWIGNIPFDWSVTKLKFISNVYNGNSLNDDLKEKYESDNLNNIPYISTKDVEPETGKINLMNGMRIPRNESNLKIAPSGSFVLCIEGGSAGKKIGYLTEDAYFVNKLACFDYNNKFLYYYALSDNFKNQFFNSLSGLIGGVSISTIRNFYTTFPSLTEQKQIATFLDYKTNLIDATIEKKKKLIELLKEKRQAVINEAVTKGLNPNAPMKDSGVEWLGEIPEHWEVVLMKRIIQSIKDGTHGTHERIINGKPLLSAKNVFNNKLIINEFESQISDEEHNKIVSNGFPQKNDILLSCVGTIGRSYVYDLDYPIAFQRSVAFLRLKLEKVIPKYIKLMIESNLYQSQLMSFAKTSAQSGVYLGDILKTVIVIPPISNQQKIIEFLDIQLYKIDNILLKIETAIEQLQEYRQSLISEAVTGKIDVRDWQPPKNT